MAYRFETYYSAPSPRTQHFVTRFLSDIKKWPLSAITTEIDGSERVRIGVTARKGLHKSEGSKGMLVIEIAPQFTSAYLIGRAIIGRNSQMAFGDRMTNICEGQDMVRHETPPYKSL
jgi:hypothetical protein